MTLGVCENYDNYGNYDNQKRILKFTQKVIIVITFYTDTPYFALLLQYYIINNYLLYNIGLKRENKGK